jgi:hypothetical protein
MNISDIKKSLPVLMDNNIVPFFWGQQGVGKTQVIKQIADAIGFGFVHLHLATQEVGDIVGLLVNNNDGTVSHARPSWFPTSGKGILFLDELNRAHPDVLQACFSLITGGTIHTHRLPEGWKVVAAGNYQSSLFNVTDTSDAAWMSRFCHIDFTPTKEEFILFAESKKMDTVSDFIRSHSEMLEVTHKERLNMSMISPDRRSWTDMIGRLEADSNIDSIRYELYSGIIGPTATAAFLTWKKKVENKISGKKIFSDYSSVRALVLKSSEDKEARFDLLNSAVEEILTFLPERTIKEEEMENFKSFLTDIPLEMGLKVIKKLSGINWSQRNDILNNKKFVDLFTDKKLKK